MTTEAKKKRNGLKEYTEAFRSLSRQRQDAFMKAIYDMSPENKNLFKIYLTKENKTVIEDLKKEIQKETTGRVGRYRKLRLSKINTILRNAQKYALSPQELIELKKETWTGMLVFILSKKYLPDRYQAACARHLDEYLSLIKHHILEKSEQEERLAKEKELILGIIEKEYYLPYIEDIYMKQFKT